MKKIDLPFASKLTSPNPVSLVCTQKPDGSPIWQRFPGGTTFPSIPI